jgi:hypothetical protein
MFSKVEFNVSAGAFSSLRSTSATRRAGAYVAISMARRVGAAPHCRFNPPSKVSQSETFFAELKAARNTRQYGAKTLLSA